MTRPRKLNLGCGFNKFGDHWNVDCEATCNPDEVVDLEQTPWPWEDNAFDEIFAFHTLEHMGESRRSYLDIIRELYRVASPGAMIRIGVPHFRHENFWHDPTHVRVITPIGLAMFDQQRNQKDLAAGGQETKLGLYLGVDLEVIEVIHDLAEPWNTRRAQGTISEEELDFAFQTLHNVCLQIRMSVRAHKPARIRPA